jgi:transcriptional regulator with XRE-family HTH domain
LVTDVAKEKDTTGFGKRLRALREKKGLSQAGLGNLCDPAMSYQDLARLERGERTPTWPTVLKLAKALGVTPDSFLAEEE